MVGDRPVHRRRGGPGRWSRRGNHRKDSTAGSPVRLSWNRDTRLKSARSLTGTSTLPADADLMLHSGYNDIQIVNVTTGRIAKIRRDKTPRLSTGKLFREEPMEGRPCRRFQAPDS